MDVKQPAPKPEPTLLWFRRIVVAKMPMSQKAAAAARARGDRRVVGF